MDRVLTCTKPTSSSPFRRRFTILTPLRGRMAAALMGAVAVVGQLFCAPSAVPLTVTKKALSLTNGDFAVTDANGAVLLKVRGVFFAVPKRRLLLDDAGNPLLSMQPKVFSIHDRWKVFRGDSSNEKDLIFSVKKSSVFQFKTKLDVFLAENTSERVCDFKVKGSYLERSVTIYLGSSDTIIAQVSHQYTVKNVLLGRDTFGVTVYPNVDYVFITALIVILDEIHREDSNN